MNFAFTDEQTLIAETARAFFAEHATSARTRAAMDIGGFDTVMWRELTETLQLGGLALPADLGGGGLGMVEFAILAEAAGAHVAALPMLSSLALAGHAICAGGSAAQKSGFTPDIARGSLVAAFASTQALQVADGRLTGLADHVPHGGCAEIFIVADDARAWLVRRDALGLTVHTPTTMDQTRPLARVQLQNVEAEPLADGPAALVAARTAGLICLAAEALGGALACLDRTVDYAKQRIQFGRPIGSFQAVKHRLADMMIEIEQARSAVYWAACAVDERAEDAQLALHAAKSFAADTFMMCASNMIQLHGGIGFTWEHDAHLYFKRARSISTLLGDGAWHRERVARLIGLGDAA